MLGLDNLSFNDIKNTSKESLKILVNNRINITALEELQNKKSTLRKMSSLRYDKLEMQPYLVDDKLATRLKPSKYSVIIKVGSSYGKKDSCPICSNAEDAQYTSLNVGI